MLEKDGRGREFFLEVDSATEPLTRSNFATGSYLKERRYVPGVLATRAPRGARRGVRRAHRRRDGGAGGVASADRARCRRARPRTWRFLLHHVCQLVA